jgi:hypothetical protein
VREKEWSAVAMGSSGRTGDCGGGESDLLLFLLPLFLVVLFLKLFLFYFWWLLIENTKQ